MKLITLALCFFACTITKAQVEIIPAVDSSLFIGIENEVTIKSGNIPLEELRLITSNGSVSGSNGKYIIRCSTKAIDALLEVVYKNNVLAKKKININSIGDPVAYAVGGSLISTGNISKKQLEELRSIITKCKPPLIAFKVVSFTAEIVHNQQSKGTLNSNTDIISPEIKLYIKYAAPGDEIIFDSIRVLGPDSHTRIVPSIRLKVI